LSLQIYNECLQWLILAKTPGSKASLNSCAKKPFFSSTDAEYILAVHPILNQAGKPVVAASRPCPRPATIRLRQAGDPRGHPEQQRSERVRFGAG